jgi:hypothetical protein
MFEISYFFLKSITVQISMALLHHSTISHGCHVGMVYDEELTDSEKTFIQWLHVSKTSTGVYNTDVSNAISDITGTWYPNQIPATDTTTLESAPLLWTRPFDDPGFRSLFEHGRSGSRRFGRR